MPPGLVGNWKQLRTPTNIAECTLSREGWCANNRDSRYNVYARQLARSTVLGTTAASHRRFSHVGYVLRRFRWIEQA